MKSVFNKKDFILNIDSFYYFDKESLFFKDLKCNFKEKSINFISGRNGIGKSTLFNIISGNINHLKVSGKIKIKNEEFDLSLNKDLKKINSLTGIVLQDYNLMLANDFTVIENLKASTLNEYPGLNFKFFSNNYLDLLNDSGIDLNQIVSTLSGGQKQILAILMILQRSKKILLLDEPTAALDDLNSKILFEFIYKIVNLYEIFVICISHDKDLIKNYSDNFYYEIKKNLNEERFIEKIKN